MNSRAKEEEKPPTMSMIPGWFGGRGTNVFNPFSLDVWDPFQGFPFNSTTSSDNYALVSTRIDWKETPKAHVFKADLPGMRKEEVKVEVEDDRMLQISRERNLQKEDKNDTWNRVDQFTAKMEEGMLTVTMPKVEEKKLDVRSIQITS